MGKYQNGGRNNTKTVHGLTDFRDVLRCPFRAILLDTGHFTP
jgi:hypothetical protein